MEHSRKISDIHVPDNAGRQLLLANARAAQYLRRVVLQRDDFEPNGKDGVGMAHRVHQGVWAGIRITNGCEDYLYAMAMIESGGVQTTENILVKKTMLNEI
jgi:hypothetical protein